jgi:hypothetical protein
MATADATRGARATLDIATESDILRAYMSAEECRHSR